MALNLNTSVAPPWAVDWANFLQKTFDELISVRIKTLAAAADLPPPARWTSRPIFVLDIDGADTRALCVSDGTNWIRTDTGAVV
jgi:hypothetical protein